MNKMVLPSYTTPYNPLNDPGGRIYDPLLYTTLGNFPGLPGHLKNKFLKGLFIYYIMHFWGRGLGIAF